MALSTNNRRSLPEPLALSTNNRRSLPEPAIVDLLSFGSDALDPPSKLVGKGASRVHFLTIAKFGRKPVKNQIKFIIDIQFSGRIRDAMQKCTSCTVSAGPTVLPLKRLRPNLSPFGRDAPGKLTIALFGN